MSLCPPNAAQSTALSGTFRDTGLNLITQGQVTFDLQPSVDTTISGNARFSPTTTTCTIQATAAITSMTRSGGTVTVVFTSANPFITGDEVQVSGAADTTYNGIFPSVTVSGLNMTYSQAGGNTSTSGETISNLRPTPGSGNCQVVQNSAIVPAGTSYKATIWPNFSPTATFVFFAVGSGPLDLTTVAPTPSTLPAYLLGYLGTTNTWTQPNTFTQTVTFQNVVINGTCTGVGCTPSGSLAQTSGTSSGSPGFLVYADSAANTTSYLLSYNLYIRVTGATGNVSLAVQYTCSGLTHVVQLTGPLTDLLRTDANDPPMIGAVQVCSDQGQNIYLQTTVTGGSGMQYNLFARVISLY